MTDPSSAPLSSVARRSPWGASSSPAKTWFQTRDGRRYGWEIGTIIVVKLALLAVLWLVFIRPWPHQPIAPLITVQQFYMPSAPPARHD
jgi:hypothetical protein